MTKEQEYTEKERAVLSTLKEWEDCEKCELGKQRAKKHLDSEGRAGHIVFGDGSVETDLVVIGIGPGENEDIQGSPFVGESGQVLDEYLGEVGIIREDIFVMNIVACRPFSQSIDFKTKQNKEENRDPTPPEREACRPLWQKLLYIIDPLVVVVMGRPTVLEVAGLRSVSMRDVQGTVMTGQIPGMVLPTTYTIIPMYHPAFLSRSGDTYQGGPWHQALVSWKRTVYILDQLRNLYYGTPIPNRGIKEEDLHLTGGR